MIVVERRQMERFSLELPTSLFVVDETGKQKSFETMSKNICSGGACFAIDQPLSVGTDVKMDLVLILDKANKLETKKTRINVSGSVIRANEQGIAVCFDKKYNISPF